MGVFFLFFCWTADFKQGDNRSLIVKPFNLLASQEDAPDFRLHSDALPKATFERAFLLYKGRRELNKECRLTEWKIPPPQQCSSNIPSVRQAPSYLRFTFHPFPFFLLVFWQRRQKGMRSHLQGTSNTGLPCLFFKNPRCFFCSFTHGLFPPTPPVLSPESR